MSVDVQGLRSTIRSIRQQLVGLEEDVARLEQIADGAEAPSPDAPVSATPELGLPPEIVVPRPDAVAAYLRAHPDTVDVVRELASALIHEFRNQRSAIMLDTEQDAYVDEVDLVFNVRVAAYDQALMDRLHCVEERFDDRLARSSGSVYVTTDHVPVE